MNDLSAVEWHARFTEQAAWTHDVRFYLLERIGIRQLPLCAWILEVGCGTGAVLMDLPHCDSHLLGIDLNLDYLSFGKQQYPQANFINGNGMTLPLPARSMDIAFCHYLLLWLPQPLAVLAEMRRVVKDGGAILALAEPDYGGRIDYPESLEGLGNWQEAALRRQGAEPRLGRRLGSLFTQAGLTKVETGILGAQWQINDIRQASSHEWKVLQHDLVDWVSPEELNDLYEIDRTARQAGERILYVPTFYAVGFVDD